MDIPVTMPCGETYTFKVDEEKLIKDFRVCVSVDMKCKLHSEERMSVEVEQLRPQNQETT